MSRTTSTRAPGSSGKAAFRAFLAHMERCYRERLEDIVLMASDDGLCGAAEFIVHGEYLATDEGLPEADGQTYTLAGRGLLRLCRWQDRRG